MAASYRVSLTIEAAVLGRVGRGGIRSYRWSKDEAMADVSLGAVCARTQKQKLPRHSSYGLGRYVTT